MFTVGPPVAALPNEESDQTFRDACRPSCHHLQTAHRIKKAGGWGGISSDKETPKGSILGDKFEIIKETGISKSQNQLKARM